MVDHDTSPTFYSAERCAGCINTCIRADRNHPRRWVDLFVVLFVVYDHILCSGRPANSLSLIFITLILAFTDNLSTCQKTRIALRILSLYIFCYHDLATHFFSVSFLYLHIPTERYTLLHAQWQGTLRSRCNNTCTYRPTGPCRDVGRKGTLHARESGRARGPTVSLNATLFFFLLH
ncbi:hypothetical protein BC827DRAFT_1163790, partial [Russula dissimulans]